MKLAFATLLLPSMASLPYVAARVGQKTLTLNSKKPLDPKQGHLAFKPTLEDTATEEHRIRGGEVVEPGEFPFFVSWIGNNGFCGGSLIHEDIILTSAQCNNIGTDQVNIGTYYVDVVGSLGGDGETHYIDTRRVHPYFDWCLVNDVMVLKITSSSSLPPVALNDDSASPGIGEDIVAIGIGQFDDYDFSDVLRKVILPTVDHDQCAADYVADGSSLCPIVEDVMLCAGPEEGGKTLYGDCGGPVLELRDGEYVQVGIISWSVSGLPDVYTRVSSVKSWIDEMICELSDHPPASCGSPPTPTPTGPQNEGGCLNEMTLDNSATLSAKIISLLDGAIFQTSDSIKVDGNASIGQGTNQGAQNHWTYVIDVSPSTEDPCVPGNDTFRDILYCETEAVKGLHAEIEASGSAVDYGLTSFSESATIANFNGSYVTTDHGTQEGDIVREVDELVSKGGTNFSAALDGAAVSVNASSASVKHVVFISDGWDGSSVEAFNASLTAFKSLNATIFSFGVGVGSPGCAGYSSDGIFYDQLQKMANETGGACKNVTNAADLGDELNNLVTSKMMNDGLTVDGSSVGVTHTKALPFDGSGEDQLSYTVPASSLATGSHEACISATGRGPADIPASEKTVGCCVTFEVRA